MRPWVSQFSDELVRAFALANNSTWDKAIQAWLRIEEFGLSDSDDTEGLIIVARKIRALAKKALESQKSLFLWSSL